MKSHYQVRKHRSGCIVGIFLLFLGLVSSHEVIASNYQNTPDASTLKIEAKESEASIILGKDLVLGPSLSTKAPIVVNSSNFYDIAPTKLDSFGTPTIVGRVSSGEHSGGNILRRAGSKNTGSRGSHIVDSHHSASKGSSKAAWKKDTYLEALRHSHNSNDPREGIVQAESKTTANRREYVQEPIYKQETEYDSPGPTYPSKSPRITYGGPSDSYSQAFKPSVDYNSNSYGPPRDGPSFYPPTSSYGPPGNSYLQPQQGYGPSIHTSAPTAVYGAPYSLPDVSHIPFLPNIDLGLPFALKLNAFTIAKILLKLVIFKMIVKFIAIICLLLFIPKLEIIKKKVSNKDDDDNEERSLSSPYASSEMLNNLEDVVKSSVEKYETQNSTHSNSTEKCTTSACRITDALSFHESWNDYLNLFKNYMEEERHFTKREEH
nr:PREDICTED: uncharacterized protein LOC105672101 [Linepithema humile]